MARFDLISPTEGYQPHHRRWLPHANVRGNFETVPLFESSHFKEFIVDFSATGMSVEEFNASLLRKRIFGGKDLSKEFPDLKNCSLYCVTEIHTKNDIDRLVQSLKESLR